MNLPLRRTGGDRLGRLAARAAVCCGLSVLPACHIPALRPAEAGPALPGGFDAPAGPAGTTQQAPAASGPGATPDAAASSALVPAQQFYTDPALVGLINQALTGNRELKILNEEVRVAQNEVLARQGAVLPGVGLEAGGGFERNSQFTPLGAAERQLGYLPGKEFPDPVPRVRLAANLRWTVDIWRELRNARDAAAQRYAAALERRDDFVTRLVADVADNYFALLALDGRLANLDQVIGLQEQSLVLAQARKDAARGTELPVQRFQAEVRGNQSEKVVVRQEVVEVQNRLNLLVGRFPQPVDRTAGNFIDLAPPALRAGLPAQLLVNRPDVRQAERELAAAGLDVLVARARFFPRLEVSAGVGWEAFNPRYLFDPGAFIANAAGGLIVPFINRRAIQAEYGTANARQLQAVYNYQQTVLDAFREVVTQVTAAENFRQGVEVKRQQLQALEASVDTAAKLFQNARAEYIEVLLAQRDLLDARTGLIDIKRRQLSAVVRAYQALGGGNALAGTDAAGQPCPR